MKLGLRYLNQAGGVDPAFMLDIATAAEEVGFDSLWVSDHVVVPTRIVNADSDYRDTFRRRISGRPDGRVYLDPFSCLAYVAAATHRIGLATGVIILPLRHPLHVAKMSATLDFLSSGRFVLGIAAGWLREEFETLGVDFSLRFRIMDEYVAAIRSIWAPNSHEFDGQYARWREIESLPRPPHSRIRLVVGGEGPASVDRAVAYGDGYFPTGSDAADNVVLLRQKLERVGRDPDDVEVTLGVADEPFPTPASGCHRIVLPVRRDAAGGPFAVGRPEDVQRVHRRVAELAGRQRA